MSVDDPRRARSPSCRGSRMTTLSAAGWILAGACGATAQDTAGLDLRAWFAEAGGDFRGDAGMLQGTTIDVEDDLGLQGPETLFEVVGHVRLGRVGRLWAGYWGGAFEGDETLARTIVFENRTYVVTTRVRSKARLDVGSLAYEAPVAEWAAGPGGDVDVGVLLGAEWGRLEVSVESDLQRAAEVYAAPLPFLGLRAAGRPWPWLQLEGEGRAGAFSYDELTARYAEARGELTVRPGSGLSAGLGYRYVRVHVDDVEFETDFALRGLYVVLAVSF